MKDAADTDSVRVTKAEFDGMRATLEKLRHGFPDWWKVSKGAGGQDQYVGYPPGMRLVDEVLNAFNWLQMRPQVAASAAESPCKDGFAYLGARCKLEDAGGICMCIGGPKLASPTDMSLIGQLQQELHKTRGALVLVEREVGLLADERDAYREIAERYVTSDDPCKCGVCFVCDFSRVLAQYDTSGSDCPSCGQTGCDSSCGPANDTTQGDK